MKKILLSILILLLGTNLYASGELTSSTQYKFMGINNRVSEKLLKDEEATDCSNISLEESGAITERDLFGQYNTSSSPFGSNSITGIFKLYTTTGKYFIACGGQKIGLGSGGSFSDISNSVSTVTMGSWWSGVTFNNKLYLFNPTIPMQIYDAVKPTTYQPSLYPTTNCPYAATHKSRMWSGGSDAIPYRLYMSALNNAESWTDYVDLPDMTQKITGLVSWGGYLYIFTENNIYQLIGSTPSDFRLQKTVSQVGAIAPRSIKISDIGIIFLARTGLFAFNGSNSEKISDKVESTINNISKTSIQNACGIFDGQGRYWLAYAYKTASNNNKILIYDTVLKEYYQYDNLNISTFTKADGGSDKGEIYGGSSTSNGIVYLLQSATGTESVSHSTQSDFGGQVTFNTVVDTVPSVILQGGNDSYTKLLLHFDGADGATTYTSEDSGNRVVSFVAGAAIDNAQKKFGPSSLFLDGLGDTVNVPDSTDWTFGTGDFTIETYVRFNSIASDMPLIAQELNSSNYWILTWNQGLNRLYFYCTITTPKLQTYCSWTPVTGQWYHVVFSRKSGVCAFFIDGIYKTPTLQDGAYNADLLDIAAQLNIGYYIDTGAYLNGWIDEVRISKGVSRYINGTSNFIAYPQGFTTIAEHGNLHSQPIQINASGTTSLDRITWVNSLPTDTKIAFQTRTGATSDTVYFNGWQYWSSASTVTFNTVTNSTAIFISSDATNFPVGKAATPQTRDVLYYEDEDNVSPNCARFQTYGAASRDKYAEATIYPVNLSSYDWLSGWYKSPSTGNSVEFSIGEGSATHTTSFNTTQVNTWEKWYWYIGGIADADIDATNYIKIKYKGDTAGYVYLGDTSAYNFYNSGDVMTSTPNDWIEYRAIFGSNSLETPALDSVTLTYTPQSGTPETSLTSFWTGKWMDFGSPQVNKQFLDFFLDVYATNTTTVYCDYDIDYGTKTGTISFPITSTANTVKIKKYFPASTYGRFMRLKFYDNDKDAKVTIRGREIRFRPEELGD